MMRRMHIFIWMLPALFSTVTHAGASTVNAWRILDTIQRELQGEPESDYTIHALRIGTTPDAKRSIFITDPLMPNRIEVSFSFWVLKGHDRVILVDTGFESMKMVEKWRIRGYRNPVQALSDIGIKPSQVTDVVVTHSHWDHIGGLPAFKSARIWINRTELDLVMRRKAGRVKKALQKAREKGLLRLTGSVETFAPCAVVVPVGLHSAGFQFVVIKNTDGIWILASDVTPLWANFERNASTGLSSDKKRTLEVQDMMLQLVDADLGRIIPGHEPGIFDKKGTVLIR